MLDPDYVDEILKSEWVEEINPGELGDHYIDETYRLKDGAPDDIQKKWEELCAKNRLYG